LECQATKSEERDPSRCLVN